MAINVATVRGYVLEELLARLLQDNGYRLLVAEEQDPEALKDSGRVLLVRGRGTTHQVDVLGELDLPLPFSLPLRLFVEAKYRKERTGVETVRNAYGTIRDVNEHYGTRTPGAGRIPMRRYQYQYALFSASGFSKPAQEYALAQQISLIDLSNPDFSALLAVADEIARRIAELADEAGVVSLPLKQVRSALRHTLGTWPSNIDDADFPDLAGYLDGMHARRNERSVPTVAAVRRPDPEAVVSVAGRLMDSGTDAGTEESVPVRELPAEPLAGIVSELGETVLDNLVLGFPPAPFVLVLLVDNPAAFLTYVDNSGDTDIRVHLEYPRDHGTNRPTSRDWNIVPVDDLGFRLSFTLPAVLDDWMLNGNVPTWTLREAKATLLSSIAIVRGNRAVRLMYQPHRG
ncbi:PDDEXK family nuclease [Nocardia macrotermitis]|uniref:Restriction endonuclease type IV Mrr domain-containing protein n=1 Tax=Nocardia macrotermitis TaxID=2585198 RepID=A0A7K0D134_9NOCA|nr:restriction endonuclease [Nocardia macrotermitis]MQY18942.1 hypothetical protein [Nocardia macrotermitis]